VAFDTGSNNLRPDDPSGDLDVYVKDLATGDLKLVSTAEDGTKGNGVSNLGSISADGRLVVFGSAATNLYQEATGRPQILVRER
jgi:Tol biopolymer transport system component